MVKLALLASLLGLVAITTAQDGVCFRPPYARMLPLSGFPPAEAFCSANVPLGHCLSTITASVTSTVSTTVTTATVTTIVLGTSTVTTTTPTITGTSILVTPKAGSTTTVTTITGTTTVTIHSTTSAACTTVPRKHDQDTVKQEKAGRILKRQPNKKHLLAILKAQPYNYISTVCSCIGTHRHCYAKTSTTTLISTASITATTSVAARSKKPITVTVTVITTATITKSAQPVTTTISIDFTLSTTIITTTSAGCTPNKPLAGCSSGVIVSTGANGCSFNNYCDKIADFPGSGKVPNPATTLTDCINACSADTSCGAYIFDGNAVTCTLIETAPFYQIANPRSDPGVAYGTLVAKSC